MSTPQADVFKAIADPTRRHIIHVLAVSGALSLHDLTAHFSVTRQAVRKHVEILREAGLIDMQKVGREQKCHIQVATLKEVFDWVTFYQPFWEDKLDALGTYLTATAKPSAAD